MLERGIRALGPYEILEPIGQGSTGAVYRARNTVLRRDVAIKILKPDALPGAGAVTNRRLFMHEAKVAANLRHPNIVTIFDASEDHNLTYIVMERVYNGRSLQRHCKSVDNRMSIIDAVNLVYKCAQALQHAHDQGIVHRDVKPRNILLDEGNEPRIGDFGLALTLRADTSMTYLVGAGSPLYMAPEQVREESLTGQTDVFALGVVLYELLTSMHPFQGGSVTEVLDNVLQRTPARLRKLRADAPKPLEQVLNRALAKERGRRYGTARDFAEDLSLVRDVLRGSIGASPQRQKLEFARRLAFFSSFSDDELRELTNEATLRSYAHGQEILAEGERSASFLFVVKGEVHVRRGDTIVASLKRGACVGEMAALTGRPRSASVRADGATTALIFPSWVLDGTSVAARLKLKDGFLKIMAKRLEDTLALVS